MFTSRKHFSHQSPEAAYRADWEVLSENLVLTPDEDELKFSPHMVVSDLRKKGWYRSNSKRDHSENQLYGLVRDSKRSTPTVFGCNFAESDEFLQIDKNLKGEIKTRLINKAFIDFITRLYKEHNQGSEPSVELIENVISTWQQDVMGTFKEAAQITLLGKGYNFPMEHSNGQSYQADLTMDSNGAYLEVIFDAEAITRMSGVRPFYALPGDTRIISHYELEGELGLKLVNVTFGSLLLKKLCLQNTIQDQDLKGLKRLQAENSEEAIIELTLLKYKNVGQATKVYKYREAYNSLAQLLESRKDEADEMLKAARKVMQTVQAVNNELGETAPLLTLTETLKAVKSTLESPSSTRIRTCQALAKRLHQPRTELVAKALMEFSVVTSVVAMLPLLVVVSIPVVLGISLFATMNIIKNKSPLPSLANVSLFYSGVRKNAVSNALDQFVKKSESPRVE